MWTRSGWRSLPGGCCPKRADRRSPGTTARRRGCGPEAHQPFHGGVCSQFLTGFKCRPVEDGESYLRMAAIGEMACDILLGDSSPLYLRLYDQGLINTSFGGAYEMMPGVAYLYAGGDSKDAPAVMDAICAEAERLGREGVDEAFYERIKRAAFGSSLRGLNSFENIAVSLTEGDFHGYDPFRFPQVFDSITREDIETFLRENITPERAVLSEIVPK